MKTYSVAAPTSVTQGAATEVPKSQRAGSFDAWMTGIGTGTYQLQISPDGTNFFDEGTALTADGQVTVTKKCRAIRWDCTAYSSGTPASVAIFDG